MYEDERRSEWGSGSALMVTLSILPAFCISEGIWCLVATYLPYLPTYVVMWVRGAGTRPGYLPR